MSYDRLLIWQYQGKPRAAATAELLSRQFGDTWQGLAALPEALDIDNAEGVNLDLVGKHVGQGRVLPGLAPRSLFGFQDVAGAKGFGKGKWYRMGDPLGDSAVLDDDDYRFLIRCRIARNYQLGTIEDISAALRFIFNSETVVFDQYDMSLTVVIRTDQVSDFKRYALNTLDILPRPAGVRIQFYVAVPQRAFGFRGAPGALGFNQGKFARFL
ncbi:DUF2612 domain-containing protein [Pseudomonas tohonis]|uniref:DUF2612 domain-containing protein n=1 Tax=Pseudomonas tohonis TaxID=2725477 RepID=UPI0021DA12DE|nr:DUF2612 domain-containing protein [Pseudomonas tohonis]UXY51320.1 DUF2612 domain-containing protein [Pseudomonas tohonis]